MAKTNSINQVLANQGVSPAGIKTLNRSGRAHFATGEERERFRAIQALADSMEDPASGGSRGVRPASATGDGGGLPA